jgi:very-short-patch-repair endonuclease
MVEHARRLRREQTPAEKVLWEALRGRRLCGLKFRRQHPIGHFVVDFYCPALGLVVEVDGGVHDGLLEHGCDQERQEWLEALGLTVMRVANDSVFRDMPGVLREIASAAAPLCPPSVENRQRGEGAVREGDKAEGGGETAQHNPLLPSPTVTAERGRG